jgi:membrane protein
MNRFQLSKIIGFLTVDIWRMRVADLPAVTSFFIRQLRIIILAVRGFDQNKCQLRASALTFYSLLAIVPVLAMAFGIAKGFGYEKVLEKELLKNFAGQEAVLSRAIGYARTTLENTEGGIMAAIGVLVLIYTAWKILDNIEDSFNDIWEIKKARSIWRKFSDYSAIMLISPLLAILSGSATVYVATRVTSVSERVAYLGFLGALVTFGMKFAPYLLVWVLFTFMYVVVPNTRVGFRSGLIAGVFAGTCYQFLQWGYVHFQIGVARYNAIYGSFAALPLFLVWLELSWFIVLFGAEYSFANQNVDTYEFEKDSREVSHHFRRLVSLQIAHLLIKDFAHRVKPRTADGVAHELVLPIRLARALLFDLVRCGVLNEHVPESGRESVYQVATSIEHFSIQCVVDALDHAGVDNIPLKETLELSTLTEALEEFSHAIEVSPSNRLLKDI